MRVVIIIDVTVVVVSVVVVVVQLIILRIQSTKSWSKLNCSLFMSDILAKRKKNEPNQLMCSRKRVRLNEIISKNYQN